MPIKHIHKLLKFKSKNYYIKFLTNTIKELIDRGIEVDNTVTDKLVFGGRKNDKEKNFHYSVLLLF